MSIRVLVTFAGILALTATVAAAADTGPQPDTGPKAHVLRRAPYKDCCEEGYRFVYAEGWYGSEKLVAPVRRGEFGDEVLVEGVGWQHCGLSCEYTLRKQSLAYWQDLREGRKRIAPPPPYPRSDFYIDGWGFRHDYLF